MIRITSLVFAMVLSTHTVSLGETTIAASQLKDCINTKNGYPIGQYGPAGDGAYANSWGELATDILHLHGNVGWHLSWMVFVDLTVEPMIAHETLGIEGDIPGALFRPAVPDKIISALQACGIEFNGIWIKESPLRQPRTPEPPSDLSLDQIPLPELLRD